MEFGSLVVPVVVSAIAVFVLSSIAHMVLPHHRNDWGKLPSEDVVLDHLRSQSVASGMYMAPNCGHAKADREDAAVQEKMKRGPIALVLVLGPISMGKTMAAWVAHLLVVSFVTGYVLRHAHAPGAAFVEVMRLGTTAAFAVHVLGVVPNSIWGGQPWSVTLKRMADGVVYALATGAIFAALWPEA